MSGTAVAQPPAPTQTKTTPEEKQKPIADFKYGRISTAVFENEIEGQEFKSKSVKFQKSWKDKSGTYQEREMTLFEEDLLNCIAALQQAHVAMHADQNK